MPTATKPKPTQTHGRAGQVKGRYPAPGRSETNRYVTFGSIAAVIFFVIDVATGGGVVSAIGFAVIIGIVAVAISFAISRTIIGSTRRRS